MLLILPPLLLLLVLLVDFGFDSMAAILNWSMALPVTSVLVSFVVFAICLNEELFECKPISFCREALPFQISFLRALVPID